MEQVDEDQDYQNLLGDLNAIHAQLAAVYAQAGQHSTDYLQGLSGSSSPSSCTSSDAGPSEPAVAAGRKHRAGSSKAASSKGTARRAASKSRVPHQQHPNRGARQLKKPPKSCRAIKGEEDEEQGSEASYDSEEDWEPGADDVPPSSSDSEQGGPEQGGPDQQEDGDSIDSRELDDFLQDFMDAQGMQHAIDMALQQLRDERAAQQATAAEDYVQPGAATLVGIGVPINQPPHPASDVKDASLSDLEQKQGELELMYVHEDDDDAGVEAMHLDQADDDDDMQQAADADDRKEWFQELPEGAPIPKGRLGALYEALASNRKLAAHLRDTVAARIERVLDLNWEHAAAVRTAPASFKSLKKAQRRGSHLHRFNAPDPLACTVGPSGQLKTVGQSRYWVIEGKVLEPNADTLLLASQLRSLPSSYERTRWPHKFMAALKRGVQAEVQAHLTQEALKDAQAAVHSHAQGQAGAGLPLPDLTQRFKEIQAVDAESAEGQRIAANFTDEQWARVSAAHVKERSAIDCKVFWLHSMRPSMPWTEDEQQRLMQLVSQLGTQQWVEVARQLGTGRTPGTCLQTWLKSSRPDGHATRMKQLWSPEDTARLEELVAQHGTNWVKVSAAFGGKFDRHQVRDRWHGQSAQRGSRKVGRWSEDEDARLRKAVEMFGPHWRQVAPQVSTRTPQQCRERWENVLKPNLQGGPWSNADVQALKNAVQAVLDQHGRIPWAKVAARIPGRTDDMCRRAWKQMQATGSVQAKPIKSSPSIPALEGPEIPQQQYSADAQQQAATGSRRKARGQAASRATRQAASAPAATSAADVSDVAGQSCEAGEAARRKRTRRPAPKRARRSPSASFSDDDDDDDSQDLQLSSETDQEQDATSSSGDGDTPAGKRSRGRGRGGAVSTARKRVRGRGRGGGRGRGQAGNSSSHELLEPIALHGSGEGAAADHHGSMPVHCTDAQVAGEASASGAAVASQRGQRGTNLSSTQAGS